ncbi:hypothetical protein ACU4GD_32825 [Cupriavidus basilensis]
MIIAHRLSATPSCARTRRSWRCNEGAIVERGRHEELLERKGMYYQLVQKASRARLERAHAPGHPWRNATQGGERDMKLFNQGAGSVGSAISYAGLIEKIEILRSTLLGFQARTHGDREAAQASHHAARRGDATVAQGALCAGGGGRACSGGSRAAGGAGRRCSSAALSSRARSATIQSCWKRWKLPRRPRRPTCRC